MIHTSKISRSFIHLIPCREKGRVCCSPLGGIGLFFWLGWCIRVLKSSDKCAILLDCFRTSKLDSLSSYRNQVINFACKVPAGILVPEGHKVSHNDSTLPSAMGDSKYVWLCTNKILFTRTVDQIWCTDLPTPDLNYWR